MHCKKTIDARSYAHETLEQLRRDAVKRVESGESPEAVAAGLGINRRTIYRWLSAYHYGGEQALAARRIPGAPAKLDARQMAQLSRMIRDKTPLQFKFDEAVSFQVMCETQAEIDYFWSKLSAGGNFSSRPPRMRATAAAATPKFESKKIAPTIASRASARIEALR